GNAGPITVSGSRNASAVLLTVRDKGPGLETGAEATIFETFAQGTGGDRRGGSGLGLAIVKGFADAAGIGVTASNHDEGGAAFTLTFDNSLLVRV
ncbi:MAG: histidine kinase, partial [Burkholderiales bacterium]